MIQETQKKNLKYLKPNINIFLAFISYTTSKASKLPICGRPNRVSDHTDRMVWNLNLELDV